MAGSVSAKRTFSSKTGWLRSHSVSPVPVSRMPITPQHRGTLGLFTRLPFDFEFTAQALFVDERILANDFDRQLPEL